MLASTFWNSRAISIYGGGNLPTQLRKIIIHITLLFLFVFTFMQFEHHTDPFITQADRNGVPSAASSPVYLRIGISRTQIRLIYRLVY
jgi:hypothetical protein